VVTWYIGSEISIFLGDQGSGFDMKYGIRDQHIFRDQGSSFGIGIIGTQNIWVQGSKLNNNWGAGIKFLVNNE